MKLKESPISTTWKNWSRSVQCSPERIAYPSSVEEVVEIVKQARRKSRSIRIVGSGHSFTPLVQTNEILLSLDRLQGLISVDKGIATVWGGTKLKALGEELLAAGWSQESLGDINSQSIAGAISTGTHGTGVRFGSISSQVVGITLVTAAGDLVECSPDQNQDIFKAAQLSLGALGIIIKVRLRVLPKFRLYYQSCRLSLQHTLESLDELKQKHRHFEFFWFPYTDTVQAKFLNETNQAPTPNSPWNHFNKLVMENGVFWFLSEGARLFPRLSPTISKLSAKGVPVFEEAGYSHRLFATPRLVRFYEMEYSIPAKHLKCVIREIREQIQKHRFAVHFPVECRYVKGDDIWLSPAYGRDSAFVAVHMYKGMPFKPYFKVVEDIFLRYDGRPHWGKMHTLTSKSLPSLYPKWENFQKVRTRLDPQGRFSSPYMKKLWGRGFTT
ncbi:FAD-binding protein [Kroppenstedtia pulmonis]|uniref:FAD-binding protein n=1 Tax=Kroppenstedtia pulmonis TaxID=1380685 RepID=A0A7D3XI34_9BACL|nr:D-arabinono-1,4-lactone oxidase [Kroppenstedtia pulmonis]QKG84184.1 FAD-binding protein [Kroppenstedtia pulmonis]